MVAEISRFIDFYYSLKTLHCGCLASVTLLFSIDVKMQAVCPVRFVEELDGQRTDSVLVFVEIKLWAVGILSFLDLKTSPFHQSG